MTAMTDELALGRIVLALKPEHRERAESAIKHIAARLRAAPQPPAEAQGVAEKWWGEVCDALSEADPDWMLDGPGGIDSAVAMIRKLAARPAEAQPVAWPDGLLDRVKEAERRIENGHAPRRIPADPSDVDLVLAEVRALLEGCDPPFWIKPPSAPVGVEELAALRIAHKHLDMGSMRVSHCKDAAAIEAALAQQPAAVDEAMAKDALRYRIIRASPALLEDGDRHLIGVEADAKVDAYIEQTAALAGHQGGEK